jgi:hypothetical protein
MCDQPAYGVRHEIKRILLILKSGWMHILMGGQFYFSAYLKSDWIIPNNTEHYLTLGALERVGLTTA